MESIVPFLLNDSDVVLVLEIGLAFKEIADEEDLLKVESA